MTYSSIPGRNKQDETNDCTVVAAMHVLGVDYATAHALMAAHGRKPRRGLPPWRWQEAFKSTGAILTDVTKEFKSRTVLRFGDESPVKGRFLVKTSCHVLAVVGGKVLDWTAGRRHRILSIFQVTLPAGAMTMPSVTKKSAKKAAPKKAAAKKVVEKKESGPDGLRWKGYRAKIVKAMKKLQATSGTSARTAEEIAKAAGLTESNVKHYCGQNQGLVQHGYVEVTSSEESRGHVYFLTPKGAKLDTAGLE